MTTAIDVRSALIRRLAVAMNRRAADLELEVKRTDLVIDSIQAATALGVVEVELGLPALSASKLPSPTLRSARELIAAVVEHARLSGRIQ
jgi:acyl carrier protein